MSLFENDLKDPNMSNGKTFVLGLQHTFTMFGATILVPILTGLDISVALFMAGAGTLLFHLLTKGKVPVFLGSSFAFIAAIVAATEAFSLEHALGGIVVAGLIYVVMAVVVYFVGPDIILGFFPPVVTGSIIMVIGLNLAGTAVSMASANWLMALISFVIVVIVSVYLRGFAKSLPVLISLFISYIIAILVTLTGLANLVDFTPVAQAAWVGFPKFAIAKFDISAIVLVAPVAICTLVEHVGDVIAVGAITNRDFIKNPGLHRTMLGDGLATSLSAMFGGPANTTYSENTGVLALTQAFNPTIMRIAACFAIVLGVVPKLGAIIQTIPGSIIGGVSIVLFGMIAAIGVRTVVINQVDFHLPRNLIIAAAILVLGIGGASVPFTIGSMQLNIQGMALAAIVGILLNKILPGKDQNSQRMKTPDSEEAKA